MWLFIGVTMALSPVVGLVDAPSIASERHCALGRRVLFFPLPVLLPLLEPRFRPSMAAWLKEALMRGDLLCFCQKTIDKTLLHT